MFCIVLQRLCNAGVHLEQVEAVVTISSFACKQIFDCLCSQLLLSLSSCRTRSFCARVATTSSFACKPGFDQSAPQSFLLMDLDVHDHLIVAPHPKIDLS